MAHLERILFVPLFFYLLDIILINETFIANHSIVLGMKFTFLHKNCYKFDGFKYMLLCRLRHILSFLPTLELCYERIISKPHHW